MKKSLLAVFALAFSHFALAAQENVEIATAYDFLSMSFSSKFLVAESVLTWRDLYLHGGSVKVKIGETDKSPPMVFKAEYGMSFTGYFTDDDFLTSLVQISSHFAEAHYAELGYMTLQEKEGLTQKEGADVSFLYLRSYGGIYYNSNNIDFRPRPLSELQCAYTLNRASYYWGLDMSFRNGAFYSKVGGLVGPVLELGFADWALRDDFSHPVSFVDIGLSVRVQGEAEIGWDVGRYMFFAGLLADFEFSPVGFGSIFVNSDGTYSGGYKFMHFYHTDACVGVKVRF
jgi:hypothetical protein